MGRSPGEGNGNPLQYSCLENPINRGEPGGLQSMGLQRVRHDWATFTHSLTADKESAWNAENVGSIPGSGRSPGEGIGYPLQYSGLENSMDCTVHGVTKSQTRLRDFHFPSLHPAHKAQNICGSCPFTLSFLFLVQVLGCVWWGRGAQVMGTLLCTSQKTEIISRCVWKIKFCNRTGVTL